MTDVLVMQAAAQAVPTVMASRGYEPDCTLGTRLLISALRHFGIPARPVPTSLVVADATMTASARRGAEPTGVLLQIGQGTGTSLAEGWDGHLVARVRADGSFFIVDPTFGQVSRRSEFTAMTGGELALIHRLSALWPNDEQEVLALPVNGGTVIYHSQPQLTWQSTSGWNHPKLATMTDDVIRSMRRSR